MKVRDAMYAPVLGLALGTMLVRLVVMAHLLPLNEFSNYSLSILVSASFSIFGSLGLHSLLQRDLPIWIARGQEREGAVLAIQCVITIVTCAAICWVAIVVVSSAGGASAGVPRSAWIAGVLHGVSQLVFLVATIESRSRGEAMRFAMQNVARATVVTAAGMLGAVVYRSGEIAVTAEAFASLTVAVLFLTSYLSSIRARPAVVVLLATQGMRTLKWHSAVALLAIAVVGFAVASADRWVAARVLVPGEFAHYAFAWTVLMVAQAAQFVVNASLFPRLAKTLATTGRAAAFKLAMRTSFVLVIVGAALAIPTWFLLDLAIGAWFPGYNPARALLPLFLWASVLRLSDFWASYLIVAGHEIRLLRLNVVVVASVGTAWWLWVEAGSGSVGALDIAVLPALLASLAYLTGGYAAWRIGGSQGWSER